MSRKQMTLIELATKVDWEGGPLEALEFGISADDVADDAVRALWQQLQDQYRALSPLVREIQTRLRAAAA